MFWVPCKGPNKGENWKVRFVTISVADPGCLSRIPDPVFTHPGSWFLPIPDPGSKNSNNREGWKKILLWYFFCNHKFHKIEYYFIFEMLKKKIWANFQRIIEVFTQKIFTMLSNIWIWDPGSRGQKGTGSRIRIATLVTMFPFIFLVTPPVNFLFLSIRWMAVLLYYVARLK